MWINISELKEWRLSIEKVVGGFEWLGFSKKSSEKMLCISSEKSTIFDCLSGFAEECGVNLYEERFIAVCDKLPGEEIVLSGQYGGRILHNTPKGEKVQIETSPDFITTVTFITSKKKRNIIYSNYGYYTCGFSFDGQYFVFAQDAGLTILKRK